MKKRGTLADALLLLSSLHKLATSLDDGRADHNDCAIDGRTVLGSCVCHNSHCDGLHATDDCTY